MKVLRKVSSASTSVGAGIATIVGAMSCVILVAASSGRATTGADACSVPAGFEVIRAAGPPLVQRPLFATFGNDGRLYVLDSGGVNGDDRGQRPPDVIRCLTDSDGDGVFDASQLFADGIVFGSGLLWYDDALYLTSPPSLWRLRDTDGDGSADERTELVTGFAFNQSCSDDAHGACLGPDGRIYFLPGRFPHAIRAPGGPLLRKGIGPWLMRCRPDGSQIEFVSGCIGNPVEVDFLPSGEMFAQGTYWAKPSRGNGLRDAVVHLVEGGEYEVRDRDYTDRIRTGELLPVLAPMSATAPSGCTIYRGDQFGAEYQHNLFGSYFNTGRIVRYHLQPTGATFAASAEDFLVGRHGDMHFTDVTEDADGSLLAVDTGGWFLRCCPTSQLAKPEILGAIYRVRRTSVDRSGDPRGLRIDWSSPTVEQLARLLDDERFAVRERATEALRRQSAAVPVLQSLLAESASPRQRLAAVWTLTRSDDPAARDAARTALRDADVSVRQAAAASVALHRDSQAIARLLQMLTHDTSISVRREVVNALGRLADRRAVPPLLSALANDSEPDGDSAAFSQHAVILALIRIADADATRAGLAIADFRVQRGALIALDQMPGGGLASDEVFGPLASADLALRRAALQVLTRHPDWSDAAAALLGAWLDEPSADAARRDELTTVLRVFRAAPTVQEAIERRLADAGSMPEATLCVLLDALAGSGLDTVSAGMQTAVRQLVLQPNESVSLAALRVVESLKLNGALDAVLQRTADATLSPATRLAAIRASVLLQGQMSDAQFTLLAEQLAADVPMPQRLAALDVLAGVRPGAEQLQRLVPFVAQAGPVELPQLLRAFVGGTDEATGRALVEALNEAAAELSPELLGETLASYPASVRDSAAPVLQRLAAAAIRQAERLTELDAQLARRHGSSARGRELFFSKANCHLCHRVKDQGGTVGPDLSSIGAIRSQRDLLEAVLVPSASFARGYEPISVILHDGRTVQGLVGRETPDELIVHGVQENKPIEIPLRRDQIEELNLGRVSLMPEGLENQLTPQELSDLFAYLTGLRQ